jgi:hypothetical protein
MKATQDSRGLLPDVEWIPTDDNSDPRLRRNEGVSAPTSTKAGSRKRRRPRAKAAGVQRRRAKKLG